MTARTWVLAPAVWCALAGCSSDATSVATTGATETSMNATASDPLTAITFDGTTITSIAPGAVIDGASVSITAPGTYHLSGTLTDGSVVVDSAADGEVRLVLHGVDLASTTTAPIAVANADRVVVELAAGTSNRIADDATSDAGAAIDSADDLTIEGAGALDVIGNAADAISSNDTVTLNAALLRVDAADDGVRGHDAVVVNGGTLVVSAGGDGVKADNTKDPDRGFVRIDSGQVDIEAGNDGVHAESSIRMLDGKLVVATALEGLEAPVLEIAGGVMQVTATDDGLNAPDSVEGSLPSSLTISGGDTVVDAGGDGIDVNGSVTMTGGSLTINGPSHTMNGAIDYDVSFEISGGQLLAAGSADMAEAPSATSPQHSLFFRFATVPADTLLTVKTPDGSELVTFTTMKPTQTFVVSTATIDAASTYELYAGTTRLSTTTAVGS